MQAGGREMAKLRAETLQNWAREAQDLELPPERAAALAAVLDSLALAVGHPRLPFDCEPAEFLRAQRRWLGETR
jgi:hypothetical protein